MDNGVGRWIYKQAVINPKRTALVYGDQEITYAELNERTNRVASALRDRGVEKGDRVVILSTNSSHFIEACFGIAKSGGVAVPVNFRLAGPEVAYILTNCRPKAMIVSANLDALAGAALKEDGVDVPLVIVTESSGPLPEYQGVTVEDFEALKESGAPDNLDLEIAQTDIAKILYTSGTTGRPKGSMLTHGAVEANNINIMGAAPGISKLDVTTTPCPLFHVGGLNVHTYPLLYLGGKVVILPAFVPAEALQAMADHQASVQFLVPAMWAALMQVPDFESYDLSHMRFGMSGGAPCPIPVIEFFQSKGWLFIEGFGMTETCAGALLLSPEDTVDRAGSVGQPAILMDARVVDLEGNDVPPETVGELILRGPNLTIGYFEMAEATADAIRDGWFYSGDLAKVSEDGFYTLVDRKKDMIITGGENVYPIEVEQMLHRHPGILECAIIGIPSEKWGETIKAVVVPKPGVELDPDEIIAYSRQQLAHFKCPTSVDIIDELPRNATGKILKRNLREEFTGRGEAVTR